MMTNRYTYAHRLRGWRERNRHFVHVAVVSGLLFAILYFAEGWSITRSLRFPIFVALGYIVAKLVSTRVASRSRDGDTKGDQ